jgi:hypothetical protein
MNYELQAPATRPVRTNWAGVMAFAVSMGATLCALGTVLLWYRANNRHDESAGVQGLLLLIASVFAAAWGLVLGIVGVVTRRGSRGLGLSIASVVLAGGWVLAAICLWIGLAAGFI